MYCIVIIFYIDLQRKKELRQRKVLGRGSEVRYYRLGIRGRGGRKT